MQNFLSRYLYLSRFALNDSVLFSHTVRPLYLASITNKPSFNFAIDFKQESSNSSNSQKQPTSRFPHKQSSGRPNNRRPSEGGQGDVIVKSYKAGVSKYIGNYGDRSKALSPVEFESFLNLTNQTLLKFRELYPKEKDRYRRELREAISGDHMLVAKSLLELKVTRNNAFNYNLVFVYLSFCFSQGMHTADLCNNIVKQLAIPEIIFQMNDTRRFSILSLYICHYDKEFLTSPAYQRLQQFFTVNFASIALRSNPEDILSIIEALTHQDILTDKLKQLLSAEAYKRVESGGYNYSQKLRLFTFLCRGNVFTHSRVYLSLLEKEALDINLLKTDKDSLVKALFYLRAIATYSPQLKSKLLEFIMEYHDHLTENTFMPILSYLEELNCSSSFYAFLNRFILETNRKSHFSISVLTLFMYKLAKVGASSEEVFRDLEKHILKNFEKYQWNLVDLKLILNGCRLNGFPDSQLYSQLEPEILRNLRDPNIDPESFGNLVFETASGAHLLSFESFRLMLERMAEKSDLSKGRDLIDMTKIMRSVSVFIVKYLSLAEKEYDEEYKSIIEKELDRIIPHWMPFTQEILKEKDPRQRQRNRFAQFLLTLELEFPELHKKYYANVDVLKSNKEIDTTLKVTDFNKDIGKVLDRLNIEYELEHKLHIYDVDIFIKPNIAVQGEGRAHYTKSGKQTHRDLLRDFHLQKLGYKVVKIPAFDFYNILPSQVEQQEEYIKEKLADDKPFTLSFLNSYDLEEL